MFISSIMLRVKKKERKEKKERKRKDLNVIADFC